MKPETERKGKFLHDVADDNGVAIVVLDEENNEAAAANNNSICRTLWNSEEFSVRCDLDCGRAFANTENGKPFEYECHAGLSCRALPVEDHGRRFVAIIGRTFLSSAKYRKATEKAISGEWSKFRPTEFFENVLMSGSKTGIDNASEALSKFVVSTPDNVVKIESNRDAPAAEPAAATRIDEPYTVDIEDRPPAPQDPGVMALRSLIGSLMRLGYREACASVLDFLQDRHQFPSLIWLERKGDLLGPLITRGELQGKPVRVNLPADNERLMDAAANDEPLVLRERRGSETEGRVLTLFPSKVGAEIRSAIAIGAAISDERLANEIVRLSKAVAPQIEILRLRDEVSTRDSLARGLLKFNESLRGIDTEDFWMHLMQVSAELVRAERASLLIHDETSDNFRAKAAIGSAIDLYSAEDLGSRIARHAIESGRPLTLADLPKIGVESAPSDWRYKTSSFISYPIAIGDRQIAVMNFTDRAGNEAFGQKDLDLLGTIAPQIAMAIDRTKLKTKAGEYEQRSITDSLTGLRNRGYLEERLLEEISQARRYRSSMCLLMIDVDHFKSYNDSFGHPAGDQVLRLIANAFRETLRTADVAARYGGEEFAILLPHTGREEAAVIAERIRQRVERTDFPHRAVTISVGVAGYTPEFEEPKDWITAADMALYDAKEQGRNVIRIYEDLGRSFREKIN
ncbi:MAG TPA: diguanylate cyclase [Pyrinomonadaceae bacterium]|nr:diguanylate cyclase [Pyrinomonadaceae bacterium]